jgi:hypothetical protein
MKKLILFFVTICTMTSVNYAIGWYGRDVWASAEHPGNHQDLYKYHDVQTATCYIYYEYNYTMSVDAGQYPDVTQNEGYAYIGVYNGSNQRFAYLETYSWYTDPHKAQNLGATYISKVVFNLYADADKSLEYTEAWASADLWW